MLKTLAGNDSLETSGRRRGDVGIQGRSFRVPVAVPRALSFRSVGALVVTFKAFFLHFLLPWPSFLRGVISHGFFLVFGCSSDPSGPPKTMKIIVLSTKIKVSPISKNVVFGTTLGAIWAHFCAPFGRFWRPWTSLGRPLALPGPPKSRRGPKKSAPDPPLATPEVPGSPIVKSLVSPSPLRVGARASK